MTEVLNITTPEYSIHQNSLDAVLFNVFIHICIIWRKKTKKTDVPNMKMLTSNLHFIMTNKMEGT